jgi:hypothetical protein
MHDAGQWFTLWCFDRLCLGIYHCRLLRFSPPLLYANYFLGCDVVWSSDIIYAYDFPQGDAKNLSLHLFHI